MKKIIDAAAQYRRDNPQRKGGIVLVWNDAAYGWKDTLRDPQHERPDVYAVDADGNIWQTVGGNSYDGAKKWEAIQ